MRWLATILMWYFLILCSGVSAQEPVRDGPPSLQFNWLIPSLRQNGSGLPLADIGGYELRYRIKGTSKFKSVVIQGASNRTYLLVGLAVGLYECQIATFDADGLYSVFVPINYKLLSYVPKPATVVTSVTKPIGDVVVKKDGPAVLK